MYMYVCLLHAYTYTKYAYCRHCILYPLRLGPLFPNAAEILRPKVGLGPNQITNSLERC